MKIGLGEGKWNLMREVVAGNFARIELDWTSGAFLAMKDEKWRGWIGVGEELGEGGLESFWRIIDDIDRVKTEAPDKLV